MFSWLVRSSYGIQGDACNDCWTAFFCPCCTANQLYQTTKKYGQGSVDGGLMYNTGTWMNTYGSGTLQDCLYSFFCMPCSTGKILERSIGMPWYLGCLCTNTCAARNLIRYQYRIAGNDLIEECAIPYGLKCFGDITQSCIPFVWFIIYGIFVVNTMQQLKEVETRSNLTIPSSPNPMSPTSTIAPSATYSSQRYLVRDPASQLRPISVYETPTNIVYLPAENNNTYPSAPLSNAHPVEMFQPVQVTHLPSRHPGYARLDNNPNIVVHNPVIGIPVHDKL